MLQAANAAEAALMNALRDIFPVAGIDPREIRPSTALDYSAAPLLPAET
jgi:hypothetical protein